MRKNFDEIIKLGTLLRNAREKHGVTIKQSSEATRIRADYLEALELSHYDELPSDVYTKGFIKNYSKYLGLNPEVSLAFFRRERHPKEIIRDETKPAPKNKLNFALSRNKLILIGVTILMLVFFGYLFSRVSEVTTPPVFELSAPIPVSAGSEQEYVTNDNKITIKGRLDIGASLKLNDVEVDTKNLEIFEIPELNLTDGENVFNFIASSEFGIETKIILKVKKETGNVTPTPTQDPGQPQTVENLLVEIIIGPREANLKVIVDGNEVQNWIEQPGTVKTFKAKRSIIIQTPRPDSVRVAINGKEQTISGTGDNEWNLIEGTVVKRQ